MPWLLLLLSFFAVGPKNLHLQRGVELLKQARFQDAINELSEAVNQDPQSYQGHFSLGVAYAQLGKPMEAEPEFRRAVELNGSSAAAHYNLGMALLQEGKGAAGIRELLLANKLAPNNGDIQYNLGTALLEAGRAKESLPYLEAAAADQQRPEALAQLARAHMAAGEPAAAIVSLDKLPVDLRQSSEALWLRAQAYTAEQNWTGALEAVQAARKQDIPRPDYLLLEARIDQKLGKPEDALPLLEQARQLEPKSAEIPYSIAFSDYVLDKHEEVIRELGKAIQSNPSMDRAYFLLSVDKLTTGDLAGGKAALAKALSLRPKNPFYLCIYGMTLEEDKPAEAATIFRQVIARSPAYALPHYHLGRILATGGKIAGAATEFATAIRLQPDMSEAWYHLAQVDNTLGRSSQAKDALAHFRALKRAEQNERDELLHSMQQGLGIAK